MKPRSHCDVPDQASRRAAGAALAALSAVLAFQARAEARGGASAPVTYLKSNYIEAGISGDREALVFLGVDSLGRGKVGRNVLAAQAPSPGANPGWTVQAEEGGLRIRSAGPGA